MEIVLDNFDVVNQEEEPETPDKYVSEFDTTFNEKNYLKPK